MGLMACSRQMDGSNGHYTLKKILESLNQAKDVSVTQCRMINSRYRDVVMTNALSRKENKI
jgi:hypothetical protein